MARRIIRPAAAEDIPQIMPVLEAAKGIMRADGNHGQWIGGYPSAEVISDDIRRGNGYVVCDDGKIVAYFAFIASPEPTYAVIYDGAWLDDSQPYYVIHRIGSLPGSHGIFADVITFCLGRCRNLRIDTHRDNSIMQHCILKAGFRYCGIILLESGDERLAYQLLAEKSLSLQKPPLSGSL
ncbi:MAG: N-acetyltransferase [Bacteroidales bacterium]|nr:N-acetyltransferase [Bacteroidales bacterium]